MTIISLLSYKGKASHLRCMPGGAQIIPVSPEIQKVGTWSQTIFIIPTLEADAISKLISVEQNINLWRIKVWPK